MNLHAQSIKAIELLKRFNQLWEDVEKAANTDELNANINYPYGGGSNSNEWQNAMFEARKGIEFLMSQTIETYECSTY